MLCTVFLWDTATKFLFVPLESMYVPVGEQFPVVFLVPTRALAKLPVHPLRRFWCILAVCITGVVLLFLHNVQELMNLGDVARLASLVTVGLGLAAGVHHILLEWLLRVPWNLGLSRTWQRNWSL